MVQKHDITVYLAVRDTNVKDKSVFTRIKNNHKDQYRQNFHIETVGTNETFTHLDGPARLVKEKQSGGFVYFMAHEISTEQFDTALTTGLPFGIVQKDKTGYITTCYNRTNVNTTTTRTKVGTPT